ncbi:MAG: hypothetical protein HYZ93_05720 [Candidatus Omnitrophica bacterium]|nr:hypothetical protein [Candidatus Omnitrophota bacterium]
MPHLLEWRRDRSQWLKQLQRGQRQEVVQWLASYLDRMDPGGHDRQQLFDFFQNVAGDLRESIDARLLAFRAATRTASAASGEWNVMRHRAEEIWQDLEIEKGEQRRKNLVGTVLLSGRPEMEEWLNSPPLQAWLEKPETQQWVGILRKKQESSTWQEPEMVLSQPFPAIRNRAEAVAAYELFRKQQLEPALPLRLPSWIFDSFMRRNEAALFEAAVSLMGQGQGGQLDLHRLILKPVGVVVGLMASWIQLEGPGIEDPNRLFQGSRIEADQIVIESAGQRWVKGVRDGQTMFVRRGLSSVQRGVVMTLTFESFEGGDTHEPAGLEEYRGPNPYHLRVQNLHLIDASRVDPAALVAQIFSRVPVRAELTVDPETDRARLILYSAA